MKGLEEVSSFSVLTELCFVLGTKQSSSPGVY